MADVIGSFAQGVGLGDRMARTWEDKERREQNNQWKLEDRERLRKVHAQRDKIHEQQVEQNKAGLKSATLNNELKELKLNEEKRTHELGLIKGFVDAVQKGMTADLTPEIAEAMRNNPNANILNWASPEMRKAFEDSEKLLVDLTKGIMPNPQDPTLLHAISTLHPNVTQGSHLPTHIDGKKVLSREVHSVNEYASEQGGGFVVQLAIQLEGEDKPRIAPVTEKRTSDTNDHVKIFQVNEFAERLKNYRSLNNLVTQPQFKEPLRNLSNFLNPPNPQTENLKLKHQQNLALQDKQHQQKLDFLYKQQGINKEKDFQEGLTKLNQYFDKEILKISELYAGATDEEDIKAREEAKATAEKARSAATQRYMEQHGREWEAGKPDGKNEKIYTALTEVYDIPKELLDEIEDEVANGESLVDAIELLKNDISLGNIRKKEKFSHEHMLFLKSQGIEPTPEPKPKPVGNYNRDTLPGYLTGDYR